MTEAQKKMKRYCQAIERRLNLPREVKVRVMTDLQSSISARREAGQTDEEIFSELDAVKLPSFYERLFRSGCEIYLKKAKLPEFSEGTRPKVLDSKGNFFALGEVKSYENGLAIKSIKLFVI